MHFAEYNTRLAAYAVIVREGTVLLTWFNGSSPSWSLPGGGVDYDESLHDAVVREVHEETGYHIEVGQFLAEHHFVAPSTRSPDELLARRPLKSHRFVFTAAIVGGELGTVEVDGTTDFAQWVPLTEIRDGHALGKPVADIVTVACAALRLSGSRRHR